MAEDLIIKIQSDFKELQNKAKETNLSPAQAEQVNTSLKAAQMALNAKDWKTFQSNFNNVLEILKTAITSSGKISQELQRNVQLQETVRKNFERLKNEQQELKNKVTESGKPTRSSQENFYKSHEKYSQVKDATGKQVTDYATVDKTTGALKDDTLLYGCEAKYYPLKPIHNSKFEVMDNVYIIGDCSGITRGLSQAGAMGIIVGEDINKAY